MGWVFLGCYKGAPIEAIIGQGSFHSFLSWGFPLHCRKTPRHTSFSVATPLSLRVKSDSENCSASVLLSLRRDSHPYYVIWGLFQDLYLWVCTSRMETSLSFTSSVSVLLNLTAISSNPSLRWHPVLLEGNILYIFLISWGLKAANPCLIFFHIHEQYILHSLATWSLWARFPVLLVLDPSTLGSAQRMFSIWRNK